MILRHVTRDGLTHTDWFADAERAQMVKDAYFENRPIRFAGARCLIRGVEAREENGEMVINVSVSDPLPGRVVVFTSAEDMLAALCPMWDMVAPGR